MDDLQPLAFQCGSAWRGALGAGSLAICAALAACGGGGGEAGAAGPDAEPPSVADASFASGAITGFGSIIVNGVHYDDSVARIVDAAGRAGSSDDLKLGMVVEIEASGVTTDSAGVRRASATTIRHGSEISGPIEAIDVAAGSVTVLGQTALLTPVTVFDDDLRGGITALKVGNLIEVHGFHSTDGRYTVTRIDDEDADDDNHELRGPIAALDSAKRTLRIGQAQIDYSGLANPPPTLAVGQFIGVELRTRKDANGRWVAAALDGVATPTAGADDGVRAELEGYVTAFTNATRFSVDGVEVDASGASNLSTRIDLGVRVEVEGRLNGGVLVASAVEVENDDDNDAGFQLDGSVTALDPVAKTFVLRGVRIDFSGSVRFEDGTAATLRDGIDVEVKGVLSGDASTLTASEIEFDD